MTYTAVFSLAWSDTGNLINDQDLDLSADVSQIVLPIGQEGEYERSITSFDPDSSVT